MSHRRFARALLVGIAIPLFLSGCAGIPTSTTKGKVSDGSYYSPLGNFVVPLPTPLFGSVRINDRNDADSGMVSLLDDAGNNEGVTYVSLESESGPVEIVPERRDAVYRSFVFDYVLPNLFQPVSPQSKVVHEEFLDSGPDRAFFAVAVIPGASSIMDAKTGVKLDSVRGLLVFDKGRFMYMLHREMRTAFDKLGADSDSLSEKDLAAAKNALKILRASIRFQ